MDASRVKDDASWNALRTKDIYPPGGSAEVAGSKDDYRVIEKVSSQLLQCRCTRQLCPFLMAKRILTEQECAMMLRLSENEAAQQLVKILIHISTGSSSQHLVSNLYLGLLDCYEGSMNAWCRNMATSELRSAVLLEMRASQINYYDMTEVFRRLPSVPLTDDRAARLRVALALKSRTYVKGTVTDLKDIVQQCISEKQNFSISDLVLGLLLTLHLGRCVTLLLPYCLSNPPEVYQFVLNLQVQWRSLATHLGYTEREIGSILRAGGNDYRMQIRLFLRVWWMPDCGEGKTVTILQRVIQEKMKASPRPLQVKDDGQALLKACMTNNWTAAKACIESRSFLEARSEDGRTPIMIACLKGQEIILRLLIDNGADIQAVDKRGDACLHFPETLRNQNILQYLLEVYKRLGVSMDWESVSSGCSPLSIACKSGAVNSARLLLEHHADPNGCSNGYHRPLVEASAQGHIGLVRLLLEYRAKLNSQDKNGYTPLLRACTNSHWNVAQVLIDEGADVNICGNDCTSPLFAAVTANSYETASQLIKRGAVIDAIRFQPGAVEGTVELTPLAHAAGKGLQGIIKLLIDSGANVNYLCSGTMPPLGFAIIGDQYDVFHQLLKSANLDRSLTGLSTSIISSVRTERYYFTERLLEFLGGPQEALLRAQQNQMDMLTEHITVYMSTHRESQHVPLQPGVHQKVDEVLTHFCRICVTAIFESQGISPDSLVEVAAATSSAAVANFFQRVLSQTQNPDELKYDFLHGMPSPFSFLIENKIFTAEMFQMEVFKFHHEGADGFYKDLIWTFHQMPGGADLPTDIQATLTQLFNGRFTPRAPRRRTPSSTQGAVTQREVPVPINHKFKRAEAIVVECNNSEVPLKFDHGINGKLTTTAVHAFFHSEERTKLAKHMKENLMQNQPVRDVEERTLTDRPKLEQNLNTSSPMPPSSSESGGSSKSNESLPSNKIKNIMNFEDYIFNIQATDTDMGDSELPPLIESTQKSTLSPPPDVIMVERWTEDVYKQREFVYTGEKSCFLWGEYGIKVHLPPSHPPTHIEGKISLLSLHNGYIIPDGYELVSALYDISADQQLPVTVTIEIEHCVPIESKGKVLALNMTHIVAHSGPPYNFDKIGGSFEPESFYGELELDHLTIFGTVVRSIRWGLGDVRPFFAALYYFDDNSANFVVTKNLQAHIHAVQEKYSSAVKEVGIPMQFSRQPPAVKLDIPNSEWKITPSFTPTNIEKCLIRDYQPGRAIPQILLKMKWTGEGAPVEEDISIGLSGVSSPGSFTLTCSTRENVTGTASPVSPTLPNLDKAPLCKKKLFLFLIKGFWDSLPEHVYNEAVRVDMGLEMLKRRWDISSLQYFQKTVKRDSEPDLLTLMAYPDGSETVDIAVRVGTSYSKFGIFLLKDGKGDIISALEKAHGRDPDVLIQEIFKKWLSGVNGVAVTWDWLVKCLYKAGLHSLGSTVENGLIH